MGAKTGLPTTTGASYAQGCTDENSIVPYVQKDVPSTDFITHVQQLNVTLNGGGVPGSNGNIVTWTIDGTPLDINWAIPTLKYVQDSVFHTPSIWSVLIASKVASHGQLLYDLHGDSTIMHHKPESSFV